MILYLDTSALVKLYGLEEGRDLVEQAVDEAAVLATSSVVRPSPLSYSRLTNSSAVTPASRIRERSVPRLSW